MSEKPIPVQTDDVAIDTPELMPPSEIRRIMKEMDWSETQPITMEELKTLARKEMGRTQKHAAKKKCH